MRNRVEIMHGVNLNMLGRRDPEQYGTLSLSQLEMRVTDFARELGLELRFFQSNSEAEFVEHLHRLAEGLADAIVLNPGAWTHYSWAIRDALEIAGLPSVEVHLSDVQAREPWRRESVVREICLATVSGRGIDGYRDALEMVHRELQA